MDVFRKAKGGDRYIGPLLFAYREVKQESLGYVRTVRTFVRKNSQRTNAHFQRIAYK